MTARQIMSDAELTTTNWPPEPAVAIMLTNLMQNKHISTNNREFWIPTDRGDQANKLFNLDRALDFSGVAGATRLTNPLGTRCADKKEQNARKSN